MPAIWASAAMVQMPPGAEAHRQGYSTASIGKATLCQCDTMRHHATPYDTMRSPGWHCAGGVGCAGPGDQAGHLQAHPLHQVCRAGARSREALHEG